MANIAAANVTYAVKNLRRYGNSVVHNLISLTFGNGALTYGVGGIPLTIGSLGTPNVVQSIEVVANYSTASGYVFQYDPNTKNLKLFKGGNGNGAVLIEASGDVPAAQTVDIEVTGW